jgi:hypothetical protein
MVKRVDKCIEMNGKTVAGEKRNGLGHPYQLNQLTVGVGV